jgi:hypothetical protein
MIGNAVLIKGIVLMMTLLYHNFYLVSLDKDPSFQNIPRVILLNYLERNSWCGQNPRFQLKKHTNNYYFRNGYPNNEWPENLDKIRPNPAKLAALINKHNNELLILSQVLLDLIWMMINMVIKNKTTGSRFLSSVCSLY